MGTAQTAKLVALPLQNSAQDAMGLSALYHTLAAQMHDQWRGRLAPTPSGYLHRGNVMNFLLNWLLLRSLNGEVGLRIDDMDLTRSRPEYIEAIFKTLDWLGLDWDFGPQTVAEQRQVSFSFVQPDLRKLTEQLLTENKAYACNCSRKELQAHNIYPGFCRNLQREWRAGETAIRFAADKQSNAEFADDWVIWRRDDLAGYHLGSVFQDQQDQVNLIIRGADLIDSSRFQTVLAKSLQFSDFSQAQIWHHPLIEHPQGGKLSKSAGAQSTPIYSSGLSVAEIIQQCVRWLGLSERHALRIQTASELLDVFQNQLDKS
ncbi:glutamyl-Q tRNA(Asp) synthetase [Thiosulfatimonas sediminis]|uniref:Glutamyl-Q tRNA(Asp) synthetase n=1 Tax=Thiosulfatimonas sediminis TaxID=2675054 RepID=A0A6F8PWI6_9GAMM|nr:glutamate--tRNA ligase family protein [Thiosulfatimonas sediminis]BBP46397.1 glutamyl-Q tRNA(Asp) synthetase [Thiosulfatimonas sediminis]